MKNEILIIKNVHIGIIFFLLFSSSFLSISLVVKFYEWHSDISDSCQMPIISE